jgi:hypothetical protein
MTEPGADDALAAAFERLLAPLAQLMVARGVTYAQVDEMLRLAVVRAAHTAHPHLPEHRRASRVSASTGLHRREVQRLLDVAASPRAAAPARSPALQVFAHWITSPDYRAARSGKGRRKGEPIALPRTGNAPSFQTLAQEVTRDVHPRALLEELLRLKLVRMHESSDLVEVTQALGYTPQGDQAALLRYLGLNVGDHFQAAVDNVLQRAASDQRPFGHFDQSLSAEGLSAESLMLVQEALRAQWHSFAQHLAPYLEQRIAIDAAGSPEASVHRLRVGVYGFDNGPAGPASSSASTRPSGNGAKQGTST